MPKLKSWLCRKCHKLFVSTTSKPFCSKCLSHGNKWPRDLIAQHNRVTSKFGKKFILNSKL